MSEPPLPADLERIKAEVAAEATRAVSRFWWAEAQKIAEQIDERAVRWEILVAAIRRVGWPD